MKIWMSCRSCTNQNKLLLFLSLSLSFWKFQNKISLHQTKNIYHFLSDREHITGCQNIRKKKYRATIFIYELHCRSFFIYKKKWHQLGIHSPHISYQNFQCLITRYNIELEKFMSLHISIHLYTFKVIHFPN